MKMIFCLCVFLNTRLEGASAAVIIIRYEILWHTARHLNHLVLSGSQACGLCEVRRVFNLLHIHKLHIYSIRPRDSGEGRGRATVIRLYKTVRKIFGNYHWRENSLAGTHEDM